ncbi:glycosyltransferase [Corticibacterium sp. UT-5YL-CI-8]|nr:glycosyltransferase [Tianweitania sp. UT-5YL-CI-8]
MRIAYFTNEYPAVSHTFIRREIRAMEARGHTVLRYALHCSPTDLVDSEDRAELERTKHVLSLPKAELLAIALLSALTVPHRAARAAWQAARYSARSTRGLPIHIAYLAEALVLAAWCRRDEVEHLHVHFGTNPATVGALVHELTGVPFSITVHGPEEFDRPHEHGLSLKIARSSFVAGVSSYGRSQLMRWASAEEWSKLHVVHCGLDQAYAAEPSPKSRSRSLLCVGRYSDQKGHLLLIEAAAQLRESSVDFQIRLAGDGPLRPVMERRIRDSGLTEHVVLLGSLPQAAIREEIRQAQAFVLPSFAEGLPVALMESMALRTPVISTYIAGIPELVSPEQGWLIPAGDVGALCDAMNRALETDQPTIDRMGELARERVLARHDIATSALLLERHMMRRTTQSPAVQLRPSRASPAYSLRLLARGRAINRPMKDRAVD